MKKIDLPQEQRNVIGSRPGERQAHWRELINVRDQKESLRLELRKIPGESDLWRFGGPNRPKLQPELERQHTDSCPGIKQALSLDRGVISVSKRQRQEG